MKTQPTWDLSSRILCKLCVGNVFVCRRCNQGRVRKKRGNSVLFKKQNWNRGFPHTSGASPSSHTACTGITHQALQQLLLGGGVYTFCTFFTCLRDNGSVTMCNGHDSRGVGMVLSHLLRAITMPVMDMMAARMTPVVRSVS